MGEKLIPEHQHTKGQFLYSEGGMVYLNTPERSYFLPARHYIWIPAGVPHSIHPSTPDVIMRNLYFPVCSNDDAYFQRTAIYPVADLLMELMMFTNRWNGHIHPKEETKYGIANTLKLLLPELSRGALPLALPYPDDPRLMKIVEYLDGHISENISFKQLADQFGISERSLARLFQKELNMSFIQYFTILRMLKGLTLLLDDKLAINEVAARVGYSSLPTFSNTFTRIVGIRPSEYVKHRGLWNQDQ